MLSTRRVGGAAWQTCVLPSDCQRITEGCVEPVQGTVSGDSGAEWSARVLVHVLFFKSMYTTAASVTVLLRPRRSWRGALRAPCGRAPARRAGARGSAGRRGRALVPRHCAGAGCIVLYGEPLCAAAARLKVTRAGRLRIASIRFVCTREFRSQNGLMNHT